jgi:regulator of protease activity HflC (stomatin/prohibitin superfamily)
MVPVDSGLHLKIPFAQSVVKMTVQTQKYEADLTAASKDLQDVNTKIAINYHIVPEKMPEIFRDIGISYADKVIYPYEQETNKGITSQFTAEELITKRESVREKMKTDLAEKLKGRGIIVEEVSIINFAFSPSFTQAIEQKVTAEQQALTAKNKLEQVKFEAQQKVASASGEAQSIEIINKQLESSPKYIEYLTVTRWDGKLSLVTGNGASIIDLGNLVTKPQEVAST